MRLPNFADRAADMAADATPTGWRGLPLCPWYRKAMHETRASARGQRDSLVRSKGIKVGIYSIYRCDLCNTLHVGRRNGAHRK